MIEKLFPYMTLIMSIGYIIFEVTFPRIKKEKFYIYSDKLFFKFVIRPIEKSKKNIKLYLNKRANKRMERKKAKEVSKKQRQLIANEKSKAKLNKKIAKVNRKASKYQKKVDKNKIRHDNKKVNNTNIKNKKQTSVSKKNKNKK